MSARSRLGRLVPIIACVTLLCGGWTPAVAAPCRPPNPIHDGWASLILAQQRPFAPTNRDLFATYTNPDWADVAPVERIDGPALSDQETQKALRAFLERRFPCAPERVQEGLSLYRSPSALEKLPDPTLRAALVGLLGTVAEPAIEFLLFMTPVTRVEFGIYLNTETGLPERVGGTYGAPDGTQFIEINLHYRFLPFAAISPLLAHEILHTGNDDDYAGMAEETIASAVEALVYMEMLLTDPSLALLPDGLTRAVNNPMAMARLNSGPAGTSQLTLFVPDSEVSIDPTAVDPLTEFSEVYAYYSAPDDPDWRERETDGHWLLWRIMAQLAEPGSEVPADGARFDADTLAFFDANQAVLSPAELVAVACVLELDLPCA